MNAIKRIARYNKATVGALAPIVAQLIGTLFALEPEVTAAIATLLVAAGVWLVPNKPA